MLASITDLSLGAPGQSLKYFRNKIKVLCEWQKFLQTLTRLRNKQRMFNRDIFMYFQLQKFVTMLQIPPL